MKEGSDPGPPELSGRVGKYLIKRSIGKGAMGQVYLAEDTVLKRDVALKVMAAQIADDPELKARFLREAQAVAKMMHPNVVTVFDMGSHTDGSPFIAMELLKGQDLQRTVRQSPLTLERKVQIIVQVLTGLNHAHQAGIVHRDIKPANIFIQRDDSVKIMDFGVARLTSASITGTGNIVGTADYMSPEQVQGQRVDGRSDLFSVGCLLYELVTGRRPFHSDNLMAIFYKITHEGPNFDLVPPGPENDALLPILKKALARDIKDRYQSAYAFAMDLRQWLRAHGSSSSHNVLEALVDLEAPTHTPRPIPEPDGVSAPSSDGTVDLDAARRPGRSPRPVGPADVRRRPAENGGAGVAARPAPRRASASVSRHRPVRRRSLVPWVALGIAAAAAGGVYSYLTRRPAPVASPAPATAPAPPSSVAAVEAHAQAGPSPSLPSESTASDSTPARPPVTAVASPKAPTREDRAASALRAARAAFDQGEYARAVQRAQEALREDPSSAVARQILDKAERGERAEARVRAADVALQSGDLAAAEREAQAARELAPWDRTVAVLRQRISAQAREAQDDALTREQRQRQARINDLLDQGADALAAKQYDAALAAYDAVLDLDPDNAAAQTGRTGAISARSLVEAAAGGAEAPTSPTRGFVAGRSVARAPTTDSGETPAGFEASPEVEVHAATQAAALPGRLVVEASPTSPKAGDRYRVSAFLVNEGSQPIEVKGLVVTTTIDGKRRQGPVTPRASIVAPQQRALVFQLRPQLWKGDTTSWEMKIVVSTPRGETYSNTLTWK